MDEELKKIWAKLGELQRVVVLSQAVAGVANHISSNLMVRLALVMNPADPIRELDDIYASITEGQDKLPVEYEGHPTMMEYSQTFSMVFHNAKKALKAARM